MHIENIPLLDTPNQSFTLRGYGIRLHTIYPNRYAIDVTLEGGVVISGLPVTPNAPIFPYQYLMPFQLMLLVTNIAPNRDETKLIMYSEGELVSEYFNTDMYSPVKDWF